MVNTRDSHRSLNRLGALVKTYVGVVVATLIALGVLSALGSGRATEEAWGHAIVVAVFAVLLPLRWRAAERGSARALRAVGVIAAVLFLVNVVEALIPGFVPTWMRVEMAGIAVLMALVVLLVVRERQ
jgi:uncharacterized membrane protein